MQHKRMAQMIAALIALITVLTLPLGVSAQGNEVVTFVYNGSTLVALHNGNIVFQPGNTQAGTVVLEAPVEFSVVSFVDRTALEAGNRLGGAEAECTSTLAGQRCSVEVAGTGDQLWLEVVLAPTSSLTEVSYGGSAIALLHGGNFVFRPGSTVAAASPLNANHPFVLVSYADRSALEAGAPLGSIAASCNTIVGAQCAASIAGTGTNTLVKIQSADFQLPAATPSAQLTATQNPLLGQATPIPAQSGTPSAVVFPSTSNTWVWGAIQGQNPMIADWQYTLSQLGVTPALWQTPPNVDNPLVDNSLFPTTAQSPAPWGIEWPGTDLTLFCQQDTRCDEVISAQHIRYYTGDLEPNGMGSVKPCHQQGGIGCMLIQVNSNGETDSVFTDQGFIRGYTFQGRYWDGNHLGNGLWGLISFGTANMTNQLTNINQPGLTNAGGNCSTAAGCIGTYIQLQFLSGGFEEGYGEFLYIKP